jgi:hypothetical protein
LLVILTQQDANNKNNAPKMFRNSAELVVMMSGLAFASSSGVSMGAIEVVF